MKNSAFQQIFDTHIYNAMFLIKPRKCKNSSCSKMRENKTFEEMFNSRLAAPPIINSYFW